ncbi:EAL domain-containing protein [Leptolyngbya sp. FACHB-17]|uniref:EAL domain-containing protein n=1 Tax=unclassified Leptolyngbya TaxID=2650499 RepID=UPI001681AA35|nr:EAL domain-containing protein [Leptolyngbya sp. FACHB-17]MBD2080757.1 EAL domain-containing protein [Leptolyngbya sp. FACHB-17]
MITPKKTLLVVGITFLGLLSTVYTVSSTILMRHVRDAETRSTRQSIQGVLSVFTQTQENFSSRFADWSSWNDTYTFVQDGNLNYIKSNLVPEALANLKVDLVLFVQPSGRVVFGTGFDQQHKRKLPIPPKVLEHLSAEDPLLQQPLLGTNLAGIILLPSGPMLIASRPILTSESKGPIRGVLIFGRYLDANAIQRLSEVTRSQLTVQQLQGNLPKDFEAVRPALTTRSPMLVRPVSEQIIEGHVLLSDLYHQPALLLRVDTPREIYHQGRKSLSYLTISLFVIGIIGGGIMLFLVQRLALFLIERQRAEAALRQVEEKYHSIFENAITGLFQTTPDGHYLSANPALAQIYGYGSPKELLRALTNIEHQLYIDRNRRKEFITLLQQQDVITKFESQVYRKDGRVIWISEAARVVRDANNQVLYYEGSVSDITENKLVEAALRESEERYALAIQGTHDGLWDWNLVLNQVFFSSRWKSMLGYEDSEIANHPDEWLNRIHPEETVKVHQEIAACIEGITTQFESEHRLLHKDGRYLWMLSRGFVVRDKNGKAYRMVGSQTDITERKQAEEQLLHDALHDSLTGLANRILFMDRLGHAIQLSKRHADYCFAVLFIDLDRFKVINDSLGHMVGDQLLMAIAERLGERLRPGDTFARLGGDEFVILLDDIQEDEDATEIAEGVQQALRHPFHLDGQEIFATASIGIILGTASYERPEDLLRDADTAMYRAKALGRGRHQVFDPSMHDSAVALLHMENDMRRALQNQEFQLYYQPIVSIRNDRINGLEALIRWQHPKRGLIMPSEFIPIAEETGLIIPLGWWVMREACRQMREWQIQFPTNPPLTISVNVSSKQFAQSDLVDQVQRILQETGLSAQCLKLEITESTVMENADAAVEMLQKLRDLGLHLSIDDFGTGYSSLGYLHRFPVDTLKIDRSFITHVEDDLEKMEIIRTVVTLAWNLGMDVVAEGVETKKQLAQLKVLRCENGQGYIFSRPLNHAAVAALLGEKGDLTLDDVGQLGEALP